MSHTILSLVLVASLLTGGGAHAGEREHKYSARHEDRLMYAQPQFTPLWQGREAAPILPPVANPADPPASANGS